MIGPNGAGKSTFFKMLTGEVPPSDGPDLLPGASEITHRNVTDVCQLGLSKSYQINQLFAKLTVRAEPADPGAGGNARTLPARSVARHRPRARPATRTSNATLALVDLAARADVPVADLAYGEKRRLEIGLALATAPSVLLLDEPLAGMSPQERADTIRLLQAPSARAARWCWSSTTWTRCSISPSASPCCTKAACWPKERPSEIQANSFVQDAYLGGRARRMSLLEVEGLNSYYGDSHILFDVSMRVEAHEVVALLGRNGAGKTTTLRSLMGVVTPRSGSIRLEGQPIAGLPPFAIARRGVQLVPEERRIFGSLNVEENLELAMLTAPDRWPLARIYETFPRLAERRRSRGTDLSGGEQQMLAIARALDPRSEDHPARRAVRGAGADHRARPDGGVPRAGRAGADDRRGRAECRRGDGASRSRAYIINNGHIVYDGTVADLRAAPDIMTRYLGI